ncbi:hypothetical protein [Clostridium celatum]|uniref:hypothetical protein n=2 Tax=Clostridium celatum TaxID=36834 RepID=UPI001898F37A|nr:hypothetical protein [Clostridium celatum]
MVYEKMSLEEVIAYINSELLKGRSMKEIEQEDFGVNERVITKRLARKNIKKIDGQFVLQDGSKMTVVKKKQVIEPVSEDKNNKLVENKRLTEIEKKVFDLEKIIKEILCTQSGSKVVTNDLGLKIYSSADKPIAKTIRLYKEIWDKIDMVKDQFPHLSYQVVLNSLLDEITEKYLK